MAKEFFTLETLIENVPHMLPRAVDPLAEVDKCDPADVFMRVFGTGTLTLEHCLLEVMQSFMLHSDDASSMTGLGIARALEDAMIQFVPHARPGPRLQFDVESIRSRAKMISRVVTDYQDLVHARKTLDRIVNRSPELIESGWAALLSNKANLEEFAGVHPEDTYLETRKIFLPQGATLILHYWQREWNEFLTKLERVSLDPPLVTVQKALSSRLHNMPRVAKSGPGVFNNFEITTHSNFPAPISSGNEFSAQRQSIPELAACLSRMLRTGVESPNIWAQTCICYTSVLTVAEMRKGLKGVLWRATRL